MWALHGHLGKSGHDVQVCVTGRSERCERASEDHGVTFAGQFLLPFDLLFPLPLCPSSSPSPPPSPSLPPRLPFPLPLLLPSHMPSAHCLTTPHTCMTGHDGNSSSKAVPLLAAEAALCADVADAGPFQA